jgi:hypothetical protein
VASEQPIPSCNLLPATDPRARRISGMTHRKGLVLDFGGVLTTPLLPAVLAFE